MILTIDNSRPINKNISRFSAASIGHDLPCSLKPFCAVKNNSSFINKNNKIYTKSNYITTKTTIKDSYPDHMIFGAEETIQSIYSADPAKLRIGAF
jgi:hypothetical protein